MRHSFKLTTAILFSMWLIVESATAAADYSSVSAEPSPTQQLVTGAACFVVTPVYGAFKLTFAGLGALTGGLAWVFTGGDNTVARKIWNTSMKGTYIITPEHLAGRKPIRFVGDP